MIMDRFIDHLKFLVVGFILCSFSCFSAKPNISENLYQGVILSKGNCHIEVDDGSSALSLGLGPSLFQC